MVFIIRTVHCVICLILWRQRDETVVATLATVQYSVSSALGCLNISWLHAVWTWTARFLQDFESLNLLKLFPLRNFSRTVVFIILCIFLLRVLWFSGRRLTSEIFKLCIKNFYKTAVLFFFVCICYNLLWVSKIFVNIEYQVQFEYGFLWQNQHIEGGVQC